MTSHPLHRRETIERLLTNSDPWLSCDDCFDETDAAVEALLATATPLDEPFRVHLGACPACHDEAQSLAALIAPDFALTPEQATERLDQAISQPNA